MEGVKQGSCENGGGSKGVKHHTLQRPQQKTVWKSFSGLPWQRGPFYARRGPMRGLRGGPRGGARARLWFHHNMNYHNAQRIHPNAGNVWCECLYPNLYAAAG